MNSLPAVGHPLPPRSSHLAFFSLLLAVVACQGSLPSRPHDVSVTGSDYAFLLADSLQAGSTLLRFNNAGKVDHEMGMALLKPGVTLDQVMARIKAGSSPDSLVDGVVGILIAKPGATTIGSLSIELLPGRTYALFCNFQDAPDKPPHSSLGMVTSRTIAAAR